MRDSALTITGEQLIETLTTFDPLTIEWDDGSSTTATIAFVPEHDGLCVTPTGDAQRLAVHGQLTLKSEDGRLDAAWPGNLTPLLHEDASPDAVEWHLGLDDDFVVGYGATPTSLGFPKAAPGEFQENLTLIADLTVRTEPARVAGRFVLTAIDTTCSTETCFVTVEGGNFSR